jgi:hypothetical protein
MIRQVRKKVQTKIIETFEKEHHKLIDSFKRNLHIYALQVFANRIQHKQNEWDKNNKPVELLKKREAEFKRIIHTRLRYGYELDGEGEIMGDKLKEAIIKLALKAGNNARFDKILSQPKFSNAQNVRLMYFSQLANDTFEVNEHIKDPKGSIEQWYIDLVNSKFAQIGLETAKNSLRTELDLVLTEIKDITKTTTQIGEFVQEYLTKVDEIYACSIDLAGKNSLKDTQMLRASILSVLEKLKVDNLNNNQHIDESMLKKPADHLPIMDRLGCTHYCPMCSAMCWGQKWHEKDTGETSKHHTSHQPLGLSGMRKQKDKTLSSTLCGDNNPDSSQWVLSEKKLTWRDVKAKYSDWKFQKHVNKFFDQIMCWFFVKYNREIANYYEVLPTPDAELKATGWLNLDLSKILAEMTAELS